MSTLIGLDGNVSIMQKPYEDPAFNNAIADINPDVYRSPGSAMNDFHWRTDVPKLDDLKKMWSIKKPKLIFGINMLTKGKLNNLNMLKYAASIGLPVDYIELGNEFNIFSNPPTLAMTIFPTGADYAKACKEWIAYIKPDFPNAKFIGVGENKGYPGAVNWNNDIKDLNPDMGLVWHYHTPSQYVFDGVPDVNIIRTCVEEEKERRFPGIPISDIYMTEFSLEEQEHESRLNPTFKTDQAEMDAVTAILQKFQEINIPLICYHNVTGADGKGAITSTRWGTWLEPPGKAMKAFIAAR